MKNPRRLAKGVTAKDDWIKLRWWFLALMLGKTEELLIKEGLKKAEDGDMNFKVKDAIGPYN